MDMALRCAILDSTGTITNILIADQSFAFSIGAIVCGTIPVSIGDLYKDGYFYRDEVKLFPEQTEIENLQNMVDMLIVDNLYMQGQINQLILSKPEV